MEFKMLDGQTYRGRGYTAIVGEMSNEKLRTPRSLRSYRKATARRVAAAYDLTIDDSSDEKFIKALVKAGLMERVR